MGVQGTDSSFFMNYSTLVPHPTPSNKKIQLCDLILSNSQSAKFVSDLLIGWNLEIMGAVVLPYLGLIFMMIFCHTLSPLVSPSLIHPISSEIERSRVTWRKLKLKESLSWAFSYALREKPEALSSIPLRLQCLFKGTSYVQSFVPLYKVIQHFTNNIRLFHKTSSLRLNLKDNIYLQALSWR